ncbi:MAG: HAMP domain-containing histidine kinase [Bacillus subtilis]|nr:HAMP domain-containing histidine kinase [Bacillus subtilis]
MKKLSFKIIFALFVVFAFTASLPRLLYRLFFDGSAMDIIDSNTFLIAMMLTLFTALTFFALAINHIIVRRIRTLSEATQAVAKGNFNMQLAVNGHDELSNLSNHFNVMVRELQANEYLSKEFVRNFSHEFKTPISSIRGYADLIVQGNLSESEIQEYSLIISSESARLANLAKNMLQLSIIDAQHIAIKKESFHLAEQIRRVIQTMQFSWEEKNIEFDVEMAELTFESNPELTHQIWHNLIENAIMHSPDHGTIEIRLSQTEDAIEFSVADHGPGIALEDQKNVFQLFFVAERTRQITSNGIGLSVTKRIVDKLGGTIRFESIPEVQTTFFIRLPVNPAA